MRVLERDKNLIYVCHKYVDEKITKYKEPIPIYEHYATTDNEADLIAMGIDYIKRLRIKTGTRTCIDGEWYNTKDLYHKGDKVYVHVKPSKEFDVLCKDADYEVEVDPVITPNQVSIMLIKSSGRN